MLTKDDVMMITTSMKLKLLTLAGKHGIEIERFTPGNVVVRIESWQQHENNILQLIEDLNNDPHVHQIIWQNGIVDIQYEPTALQDKSVIENWLMIFEKYSF